MNMVYDLLLNFDEEIYEFFEWNKDEEIEHIKKIPLFLVNNDMILDMFNKQIEVESSFLESIYNKCEKYNMEHIPYACLFTDGITVIAIEFNEEGKSVYFSRLQLIDEDEITKYLKKETTEEINYKIICVKHNKQVLTKKEKQVQKFLEREIISSFETCEFSKLKYLYLEYFEKEENDLLKIRDELLNSITNITKKHMELYELLRLTIKKKVS